MLRSSLNKKILSFVDENYKFYSSEYYDLIFPYMIKKIRAPLEKEFFYEKNFQIPFTGKTTIIPEYKMMCFTTGELEQPQSRTEWIANLIKEGAKTIAINTVGKHHHGSKNFVRETTAPFPDTFFLEKNFFCTRNQIYEAKLNGISGITILLETVTPFEAGDLIELARMLNMVVFLESQDPDYFNKFLDEMYDSPWEYTNKNVVLVLNLRNFQTLELDHLHLHEKISSLNKSCKKHIGVSPCPSDMRIAFASGINTREDVEYFQSIKPSSFAKNPRLILIVGSALAGTAEQSSRKYHELMGISNEGNAPR